MKGAYRGIKAKVVRNIDIPVKDRLSVVVVYLLSKGFFQASTWRSLKVAEAIKFYQSLMAIYRGVLRVDCLNCIR